MALRIGLEPTSFGSTIRCSAIELPQRKRKRLRLGRLRLSVCRSTHRLHDNGCLLVHRHRAETRMPVDNHDCLFGSVAIHSSYISSQQLAYREPCELQMRATQPCSALLRLEELAALQTAELSEDFGIKPLSKHTEARLCVYMSVCNAGVEPAPIA